MSADENPKSDSTVGATSRLFLGLVFLFLLVGMCLPTLSTPKSHTDKVNCQSKLRNLVFAVLNYESENQFFPHAVYLDRGGAVPRSWRVELLPQLEQQALRDAYQDNKPWNSPENLDVAKVDMPIFRCSAAQKPSRKSNTFPTNYVLITGSETAFPDDRVITFRDIKDGSSNTIIMIEINESDIAWTEPRDLTVDEALALFNRPEDIRKNHPTSHPGGRVAAFADGHVDFVPEDTPPEVLRGLFTIAGGEAVYLDNW